MDSKITRRDDVYREEIEFAFGSDFYEETDACLKLVFFFWLPTAALRKKGREKRTTS